MDTSTFSPHSVGCFKYTDHIETGSGSLTETSVHLGLVTINEIKVFLFSSKEKVTVFHLVKMHYLGITWNYEPPFNTLGQYTNYAMHAAGDRAMYGCGPDNSNIGGFCPQMTIAYSIKFKGDRHSTVKKPLVAWDSLGEVSQLVSLFCHLWLLLFLLRYLLHVQERGRGEMKHIWDSSYMTLDD